MKLRELLTAANIIVPLEATSLREAVIALVQRLAQQGLVRTPPSIDRLVSDTSGRDLVTIGERIALPHQRTDAVDRLTVALGVAPQPLATPEIGDRVRPQIVILILAPRDGASRYLQTLAALGRLLRQDRVVDALLAARSPEDVIAIPELHELSIEPELAVRHIMAHHVPVASPEATARDVVEIMVREHARAVVVTGEKHEVLGIVSEVDVMRALLPQIPRAGEQGDSASLPPIPVREIMTRSVLCVSADMGLDEAARLMINKDVEQLPVVSEGKLTGLLTRSEIIRKLFAR